MSAAGSPATGNGNGSQRYSVRSSPLFASLRAQLEADFPRLVDIFRAVEGQLAVVPMHLARNLSANTWLHQTLPGLGVPSLMIYYEIFENPHRTVVLQAVHAPEE